MELRISKNRFHSFFCSINNVTVNNNDKKKALSSQSFFLYLFENLKILSEFLCMSMSKTILSNGESEVIYIPNFLNHEEALLLFNNLKKNTHWARDQYQFYGKTVYSARKVASYGDLGIHYRYSGVQKKSNGWNQELGNLKKRIQAKIHQNVNYALLNLYEDGNDSISWHADNEADIVENSTIASISLGATREFKLKANQTGKITSVNLEHGSLLLMKGKTQKQYKHCVPKRKNVQAARINLTFRQIRNK